MCFVIDKTRTGITYDKKFNMYGEANVMKFLSVYMTTDNKQYVLVSPTYKSIYTAGCLYLKNHFKHSEYAVANKSKVNAARGFYAYYGIKPRINKPILRIDTEYSSGGYQIYLDSQTKRKLKHTINSAELKKSDCLFYSKYFALVPFIARREQLMEVDGTQRNLSYLTTHAREDYITTQHIERGHIRVAGVATFNSIILLQKTVDQITALISAHQKQAVVPMFS